MTDLSKNYTAHAVTAESPSGASSNGQHDKSMMDWALTYAAAGIPVFPLLGKRPIEDGGFHQATTDPDTIKDWWGKRPAANIGTPTGLHIDVVTKQQNRRPFYVIDSDPLHGGNESLTQLQASIGALPDTATQITGSGGYHYCFTSPVDLKNSAGQLGDGVDVRGTGGYIVIEPSLHPKTHEPYRWPPGLGLMDGKLAELPAAWQSLMQISRAEPAKAGLIPAGLQETTLMKVAGAARRQNATYEEILALITVIGKKRCVPPVADDDLERMARSATTYEPLSIIARAAQTDLGNAERLVAVYDGRILYNASERQWLIWDNRRWKPDDRGAIVQLMADVARRIEMHALNMPSKDPLDRIAKAAMESWARRSQSHRGLSDALKVASTMVAVTADELDQHLHLLNVLNGTIDLRTGEMQPHDPTDRLTLLAGIEYDSGASLDEWDNFIAAITQDDEDLASFLQTAMGYSATGETKEDKLFMPIGPTRTGKTTFIGAVKGTLGDYAATADFSTFLKRPTDSRGASGDVARLAGKRFVSSIEVDEGKKLAEALVKQMTGGDTITARHMYRAEFEFTATYKLWLIANHAPVVNAEDDAIWERILRLPFERHFTAEERDLDLKARLADPEYAGPAILAWIVGGAKRWYAKGLSVPESVTKATAAYRESQDPIRSYLEETCNFDSKAVTSTSYVWGNYLLWCKTYRTKPVGKLKFQEQVQAVTGKERKRAKGGSGWVYPGIELIDYLDE